MTNQLAHRTIEDFGRQWAAFKDNEGWYGSLELFSDIVTPLLNLQELSGKNVAEIGSGSGRIVKMLLDANVNHVTAIEPSAAFQVLNQNLESMPDAKQRVRTVQVTGDKFLAETPLDYIFSIGVLHHIPEPEPVVQAAFKALKPGGKLFVWLYGYEGNELYLRFVEPLRIITTRLPHPALRFVVALIDLVLIGYHKLCRFMQLPLKDYIENVVGRFSPEKRRLVIYDQLNPAYAKYYKKEEAEELLSAAGFTDVRLYRRHGYSWSVVGIKPKLS